MIIRCEEGKVVERLLENNVEIEHCTFRGSKKTSRGRIAYWTGRRAWGNWFPILVITH